jgi:hypothetical protein
MNSFFRKRQTSFFLALTFLMGAAAGSIVPPWTAAAQSSAGPTIAFEAHPTGVALERNLVITLTDAGRPVSDATVEVTIDMPSMPMIHRIPKSRAVPTGKPGQYAAKVTLEMAGEWTARIVIDKPKRTTFVEKFQADGDGHHQGGRHHSPAMKSR